MSGFRNNLWNLQKDGKFTDVTLEVGDDRYDCHKNVLISNNGYFRDLFMSGFEEESAAEVKIRVPDPNNNFKHILEYIYTGNTSFLTFQNASSIMLLSFYFQLDDLFTASQNFISQNIDKEDKTSENFSLGISNLVQTLQFKALLPVVYNDKFKDAIASNFEFFMKDQDFYKIPSDLIRFILSRSTLKVPSEGSLAVWIDRYIMFQNGSLNANIDYTVFKNFIKWDFLTEEDWNSINYQNYIDENLKAMISRNSKKTINGIPRVIYHAISSANFSDIINHLHRYSSTKINIFKDFTLINNNNFIENSFHIIVNGLSSQKFSPVISTDYSKNGGLFLDKMEVVMTQTRGVDMLCLALIDRYDTSIQNYDIAANQNNNKNGQIKFEVFFKDRTVFNNLILRFIQTDKRKLQIQSLKITGFSFSFDDYSY